MATFLEMQDEVLAHGFDPSYYRARIKNWLNEAQARIARLFELRELYTTTTVNAVAGTSVYTLPSDVVRITGVTDASSTGPNTLEHVADAADLTYWNNANSAQGTPQQYALGPTGLVLSPIPDSSYTLTVDYYKDPTTMTNDSDISVITDDYHDVMVSYALSRAYRSEDDMQMSQFFYAEFMRDLQFLGVDRQAEVRDSPRQVPGMWNV